VLDCTAFAPCVRVSHDVTVSNSKGFALTWYRALTWYCVRWNPPPKHFEH